MSFIAPPGGPRRIRRLVVGMSALALVVAGCGQSATQPAASAPVSVAHDSKIGGTANTSAEVTDFQKYIGGKAGKATGEPIPIGWLNTEGGAVSFPDATKGARAAVAYINAELGGVDGRPLKLVECLVGNAEEEGQGCAQRFANDSSLPLVVAGQMAVGNASYYAQMNGAKPTITGVAAIPADFTAKNVFALFGSSAQYAAPFATYVTKVLKGKSLSFFYHQLASTIPLAKTQGDQMRAGGLTVKTVGFESASTDLLGPLTASGARTADAMFIFINPPDCVNVVKALKAGAIKTPVLAGVQCLSPEIAKALGDLPKWTYGLVSTLSSDTSDPGVRAYQEAVGRHGLSAQGASGPLAALGFANVMFAARLLNAEGPAAGTAKLVSAIKAYRGPLIMGPPGMHCGLDLQIPSSCSNQTTFYTYQGNGKFQHVSGWLGPQS